MWRSSNVDDHAARNAHGYPSQWRSRERLRSPRAMHVPRLVRADATMAGLRSRRWRGHGFRSLPTLHATPRPQRSPRHSSLLYPRMHMSGVLLTCNPHLTVAECRLASDRPRSDRRHHVRRATNVYAHLMSTREFQPLDLANRPVGAFAFYGSERTSADLADGSEPDGCAIAAAESIYGRTRAKARNALWGGT